MVIGPAAVGSRFRQISVKRDKKEGSLIATLTHVGVLLSLRSNVDAALMPLP